MTKLKLSKRRCKYRNHQNWLLQAEALRANIFSMIAVRQTVICYVKLDDDVVFSCTVRFVNAVQFYCLRSLNSLTKREHYAVGKLRNTIALY